jgi:hypothetical protein
LLSREFQSEIEQWRTAAAVPDSTSAEISVQASVMVRDTVSQ